MTMKKIILLVFAVIAFASLSIAQKSTGAFHIGAKAGANLNKIDGVSFKDGYELGYQLGGFAEIDFNQNWGIQPEVLFSQSNPKVAQGAKAIYQNIDNAILGDHVKLNYLNIP